MSEVEKGKKNGCFKTYFPSGKIKTEKKKLTSFSTDILLLIEGIF